MTRLDINNILASHPAQDCCLPQPSPYPCFWSILFSHSLNFEYISASLSRHLGPEKSAQVLQSSLFDYIHPEEVDKARLDLTDLFMVKRISGSVTTCRLRRFELRKVGFPQIYRRASESHIRRRNSLLDSLQERKFSLPVVPNGPLWKAPATAISAPASKRLATDHASALSKRLRPIAEESREAIAPLLEASNDAIPTQGMHIPPDPDIGASFDDEPNIDESEEYVVANIAIYLVSKTFVVALFHIDQPAIDCECVCGVADRQELALMDSITTKLEGLGSQSSPFSFIDSFDKELRVDLPPRTITDVLNTRHAQVYSINTERLLFAFPERAFRCIYGSSVSEAVASRSTLRAMMGSRGLCVKNTDLSQLLPQHRSDAMTPGVKLLSHIDSREGFDLNMETLMFRWGELLFISQQARQPTTTAQYGSHKTFQSAALVSPAPLSNVATLATPSPNILGKRSSSVVNGDNGYISNGGGGGGRTADAARLDLVAHTTKDFTDKGGGGNSAAIVNSSHRHATIPPFRSSNSATATTITPRLGSIQVALAADHYGSSGRLPTGNDAAAVRLGSDSASSSPSHTLNNASLPLCTSTPALSTTILRTGISEKKSLSLAEPASRDPRRRSSATPTSYYAEERGKPYPARPTTAAAAASLMMGAAKEGGETRAELPRGVYATSARPIDIGIDDNKLTPSAIPAARHPQHQPGLPSSDADGGGDSSRLKFPSAVPALANSPTAKDSQAQHQSHPSVGRPPTFSQESRLLSPSWTAQRSNQHQSPRFHYHKHQPQAPDTIITSNTSISPRNGSTGSHPSRLYSPYFDQAAILTTPNASPATCSSGFTATGYSQPQKQQQLQSQAIATILAAETASSPSLYSEAHAPRPLPPLLPRHHSQQQQQQQQQLNQHPHLVAAQGFPQYPTPNHTHVRPGDATAFVNAIPYHGRHRPLDADRKYCMSCGTINSPEWRRGPNGHKTLCNACGLRYSRSIARANRNNGSTATSNGNGTNTVGNTPRTAAATTTSGAPAI